MALEFEWDPQKPAANLAKQKVSFEEAATVFGDTFGRIERDRRHSFEEERFVLLGFREGIVCSPSCTPKGEKRFA